MSLYRKLGVRPEYKNEDDGVKIDATKFLPVRSWLADSCLRVLDVLRKTWGPGLLIGIVIGLIALCISLGKQSEEFKTACEKRGGFVMRNEGNGPTCLDRSLLK